MFPHDQAAREQAARHLLRSLRQRTRFNQGIGILQAWTDCERQQARRRLLDDNGVSGRNAEADRMIAVVDEEADGTADPDADWD